MRKALLVPAGTWTAGAGTPAAPTDEYRIASLFFLIFGTVLVAINVLLRSALRADAR
jgi:hypothetical protein